MSLRSYRVSRSFTLISTLLLSTTLAAPAFAQIEEVVVTAQKKSEDIQTVPIAVTAYTGQDLKDRQIQKFDDLQFATPNVTYSQGNFGGANFQIRGLGVTAVGGGSESGVAINFADVFLASPSLDGSSFYDLQDLEVLRGPQSTLYGRGATGGAVNIAPKKPDLEAFGANVDVSYGNYNGAEVTGAVNIPIITDQLGARIAGDWIRHDGFTKNDFDDSHQNGRDQYSVRGSVLWEPTSSTSISVVGQFSKENDDRARADKQFCNPDPTGTLGCTPGKAETGAINLNATYLNNFASSEAIAGTFSALQGLGAIPATSDGGAFLAAATSGANLDTLLAQYGAGTAGQHAVAASYAGAYGLGNLIASGLGLTHLGTPYVGPANANPSNLRQVNDDFNPINRQSDNFVSMEVKQDVTDWLAATLVGGYDHSSYFNQQSYTNTLGPTIDPANLASAEGLFNFLVGTPGLLGANGSPGLAAAYAPFFAQAGALPVSNFKNLGISSNNINRFTSLYSANDQASGESTEESLELRFNSKFQGPVNFMVGGYYLQHHENSDYYVGSNSLDYASILLGGAQAALSPLGTPALLAGPSYYDDEERNIDLRSESVFAEVYYDIVPDLLKLTVGGRYNEDWKSEDTRIPVLDGIIPLGASNYDQAVDNDGANTPFEVNDAKFDSTTGRVVLNYTPKLDFTDQTMFYASYAHGYKAGGFNPGIPSAAVGVVPNVYAPEKIDAYELGTKNILLDGHLQANADIWYYDYTGLQVSAIVDNTSVNENIAAKLYGVEGEFVWLATDNLQFNLNIAKTHSGVDGGVAEVDERNPTGGDPRAILVKDDSLTSNGAGNCVIYDLNAGHAKPQLPTGYTLVPSPLGFTTAQFVAPPGGAYALTGSGIAASAYGSCSTSPQLAAFLASQGYAESDPAIKGSNINGVPVNLKGNQMQQTPDFTVSVGAQYTFNLDSGYTLVPRVDYYFQTHMWGRIFHDPADFISSWDVVNGQITLTAPDKNWYVGAYIKNAFDKTYVTGQYLTSATSGLYTNAFLGDPRTYGLNAGIKF